MQVLLERLRESMPDLITDQFETLGRAVAGCDVIVGANAHRYAAPSIAERAGIAFVTAASDPDVEGRARALAGRLGRDGAEVAAGLLEDELAAISADCCRH
jgi:hypothetical protein